MSVRKGGSASRPSGIFLSVVLETPGILFITDGKVPSLKLPAVPPWRNRESSILKDALVMLIARSWI